jgi:hypothetical protein
LISRWAGRSLDCQADDSLVGSPLSARSWPTDTPVSWTPGKRCRVVAWPRGPHHRCGGRLRGASGPRNAGCGCLWRTACTSTGCSFSSLAPQALYKAAPGTLGSAGLRAARCRRMGWRRASPGDLPLDIHTSYIQSRTSIPLRRAAGLQHQPPSNLQMSWGIASAAANSYSIPWSPTESRHHEQLVRGCNFRLSMFHATGPYSRSRPPAGQCLPGR